ncbi:MAG: carbamoylphosphate synthase large subunit [Ruminococcaceae bacterium]|nr:carbamoylphosphate synthase large subunit [Oscillospiraceae bacterium]
MNYVFISPNFPVTCEAFCDRLRQNGVTVLGVGDAPYDGLSGRLKGALTEYYQVPSLSDYDQVYRAVAFFAFKYGRIDWLESLNEYWLGQDARLRADFNIAVGTRADGVADMVDKSRMKRIFLEAGVPTARQHVVTTREEGRAFAAEAGYPVVVKPSVGVGAAGARKLKAEAELDAFYDALPQEPYVMEQFLSGDIATYDAILDSRCEPLFESMNNYASVMDAVLNDEDVSFYTSPAPAPKLCEYGRRLARAFGADRRFVHFEFICLDRACKGVGKRGDYAVMEVNMRPAGGHDPDMMNFAQSADVFQIYAEMVTQDKRLFPVSDERYFCAYAARKDGRAYRHTDAEITERFGAAIVLRREMPEIDWPAMGRWAYMARFREEADMREFTAFVLQKND